MSMKKGELHEKNFCIVTWYTSSNCGTCLQARALYEKISEMASVSMLSYKREYSIFDINDFKLIIMKIKNKLSSSKQKNRDNLVISDIRNKRIQNFVNDINIVDLPKSKKRNDFVDKYDKFVVGSDQLWNPYWFNPTYFLDFVNQKNKKVSYATSIGVSSLENKNKK